jgi:hypothetical protein
MRGKEKDEKCSAWLNAVLENMSSIRRKHCAKLPGNLSHEDKQRLPRKFLKFFILNTGNYERKNCICFPN